MRDANINGGHCIEACVVSERLHNDGIQQGHVLRSSDGQLVSGVVVDDFGDGAEWRAVLSQHIASIGRLRELHVHKAFAAPDGERVVRSTRLTVPHEV